jgi:hypothetical protein
VGKASRARLPGLCGARSLAERHFPFRLSKTSADRDALGTGWKIRRPSQQTGTAQQRAGPCPSSGQASHSDLLPREVPLLLFQVPGLPAATSVPPTRQGQQGPEGLPREGKASCANLGSLCLSIWPILVYCTVHGSAVRHRGMSWRAGEGGFCGRGGESCEDPTIG